MRWINLLKHNYMQRQDLDDLKKRAIGIQIKMAVTGTGVSD
jgi:hypothetical protein